VDIFSAVLSGANYGPWVPPFVAFLNPLSDLPGKGIGHFVGAMCIDAFRDKNEFKANIDNWIDRFKRATPIENNQPVLIPGEPELEQEQMRKKDGIPINDEVWNDLNKLANKLNIELPKVLAN
ncbi:MAG: Ldh family oxidoreductase, partial [Bacteroidia bacterium]|nr:Ldh family oxidoreductase [Bacteroidia bacterium]